MPSTVVLTARALAALAVLGWGWYIVAAFRTQQFGPSLAVLGVAVVFVLPVAVLPFVGLRYRSVVLGVGATLLAVVAAAEACAALEESRFVRAHRARGPEAGVVVRERGWPFAHHYLFFDPGAGRWGAGD